MTSYIIICIAMVMSIIFMTSHVKADKYAYTNNINKCLFDTWPGGVLKDQVKCSGSQLCYSASGKDPAQYAVCYNTNTLIPDFTGHVVPTDKGASGRYPFYDEEGPYKPDPQSDQEKDYEKYAQKNLYPNFDAGKEQFCARGHLTPNNVFSTDDEREITMINTNIAPQWQLFNAFNWAGVESAVKKYAEEKKKQLYVFTGTAGVAKVQLKPGEPLVEVKLNGRVTAPKYYWKVVCDPSIGQSLVLLALNNIGDISTDKVPCNWNPSKMQTSKKGVIVVYSLEEAEKLPESCEFSWPPLGAKCNPAQRGTFLDEYLNRKLIS